jgi:hypothetical protein
VKLGKLEQHHLPEDMLEDSLWLLETVLKVILLGLYLTGICVEQA